MLESTRTQSNNNNNKDIFKNDNPTTYDGSKEWERKSRRNNNYNYYNYYYYWFFFFRCATTVPEEGFSLAVGRNVRITASLSVGHLVHGSGLGGVGPHHVYDRCRRQFECFLCFYYFYYFYFYYSYYCLVLHLPHTRISSSLPTTNGCFGYLFIFHGHGIVTFTLGCSSTSVVIVRASPDKLDHCPTPPQQPPPHEAAAGWRFVDRGGPHASHGRNDACTLGMDARARGT